MDHDKHECDRNGRGAIKLGIGITFKITAGSVSLHASRRDPGTKG